MIWILGFIIFFGFAIFIGKRNKPLKFTKTPEEIQQEQMESEKKEFEDMILHSFLQHTEEWKGYNEQSLHIIYNKKLNITIQLIGRWEDDYAEDERLIIFGKYMNDDNSIYYSLKYQNIKFITASLKFAKAIDNHYKNIDKINHYNKLQKEQINLRELMHKTKDEMWKGLQIKLQQNN